MGQEPAQSPKNNHPRRSPGADKWAWEDSNRGGESRGKPPSTPAGAAESAAVGAAEGRADLAGALALIDRLPLSDAERAEAVRRLLAGGGGA